MPKATDAQVKSAVLYFLPVKTRMPLKFGAETLTSVTCARVSMEVESRDGRRATGWGETPLSVQWVWPSNLSYQERHEALQSFCIELAKRWTAFDVSGHPIEIGHAFIERELPVMRDSFNKARGEREPMPWLAALVCCSCFDIALHDAYGILHDVPIYDTYNEQYMNADLSAYLEPTDNVSVDFRGQYPQDYLVQSPPKKIPAWHLVGGKDPLGAVELSGGEPADGYPVLLEDWIERDHLKCLKIKLRGNDATWDFQRLTHVGELAIKHGVDWLSADFNCTVSEPAYVNNILDRLMQQQPRIYGMILYVEQPFPYNLEANRIEVRSVSARKPLFMDESAHDWKLVRLGRELGWTGVALKTCKTQTGALLSLCWARAHGMTLMVQDLTNPMLAQIPHVLLAAHAGTIMGVETNSMQFYPEASKAEAEVHPGIYTRRNGCVDLSTIIGPGFGYRIEQIERSLPNPVDSD